MNHLISAISIIVGLTLLVAMLMRPKSVERRVAVLLAISAVSFLAVGTSGMWSERLAKHGTSAIIIIGGLTLLAGMLMRPEKVERRARMLLAGMGLCFLVYGVSDLLQRMHSNDSTSKNPNVMRLQIATSFVGGIGTGIFISVLVLEKRKGG